MKIFLKNQINKTHRVLFEKQSEGHSENFIPIISKSKHRIGDIVSLKGKYINNEKLIAQAI